MSQKANNFKIGLFVIAGVVILLGGLVLFGLRESLESGVTMETYFDDTVQGLEVGSSVKFRGVKIGKITEIKLVLDAYPNVDQKYGYWLLVRAKVRKKFFEDLGVTDVKSAVEGQVAKGMRTYLAPQGITGLVFLELNYRTDLENANALDLSDDMITPPWTLKESVIYVPSTTGFLKSFMDTSESIADSIEQFMQEDFPRLTLRTTEAIEQFTQTNKSVEGYLQSDQLRQVPERVNALLANLENLTGNKSEESVRAMLADAQQITSETLAIVRSDEIRGSMTQFRTLIERTNTITDDMSKRAPELAQLMERVLVRMELLVSAQQYDVEQITNNLRRASENIAELTQRLNENPSRLLFSEDPRPVEQKK